MLNFLRITFFGLWVVSIPTNLLTVKHLLRLQTSHPLVRRLLLPISVSKLRRILSILLLQTMPTVSTSTNPPLTKQRRKRGISTRKGRPAWMSPASTNEGRDVILFPKAFARYSSTETSEVPISSSPVGYFLLFVFSVKACRSGRMNHRAK